MGLTGVTVGKWRKRYRVFGLEGLHDELRPGRPRTYEDDKVAEVINRVWQSMFADGSTQSINSLLGRYQRHFQTNGASLVADLLLTGPSTRNRTALRKPNGYKLSNDPFFVEKERDIVGLYLNPPDQASVLSVDEKTQIQALDRSHAAAVADGSSQAISAFGPALHHLFGFPRRDNALTCGHECPRGLLVPGTWSF
jgi:putative transposase